MKFFAIFFSTCVLVAITQSQKDYRFDDKYDVWRLPEYSFYGNYPLYVDYSRGFEDESYYNTQWGNNRFLKLQRQPTGIQPRLFFNLFNSGGGTGNGLLGLLFRPSQTNVAISLATTTVTSKVTTAVMSSCIPLEKFTRAAVDKPYSTNPCRRKRITTPGDLFGSAMDTESDSLQIMPSNVANLEPTVIAVSYGDVQKERLFQATDRIASSKNDYINNDKPSLLEQDSQPIRKYRQTMAASTTTTTQYEFAATITVWKTASAIAGEGVLGCMPGGFQVCPA